MFSSAPINLGRISHQPPSRGRQEGCISVALAVEGDKGVPKRYVEEPETRKPRRYGGIDARSRWSGEKYGLGLSSNKPRFLVYSGWAAFLVVMLLSVACDEGTVDSLEEGQPLNPYPGSFENLGKADSFQPDLSAMRKSEPVHIDGNQGFSSENGVVNPLAKGTKDDPFIIENLDVRATLGVCFSIHNTSRHFVIRNSKCSGANTGIDFANVKNGIVELTLISGILAEPGQYPSNNASNAFAIAIKDSDDLVFGPGVVISYVYGGAGSAGSLASPNGGSGGDAYAVFVDGTNRNLSFDEMDIRYIYGGAGGAGAGNKGNGGDGGQAYAFLFSGSNSDLSISESSFSYIYAGAGGAGSISSGNGGNGGSVFVLETRGVGSNIQFKNNSLSLVYGGAGAAGAASLEAGGSGGNGGRGGDVKGLGFASATSGLIVSGNEFSYVYAGAGGAGAVGTLGTNGGSGGHGAPGGSIVLVEATDRHSDVSITGNSANLVYAGAGAAGGVGAMGMRGGDGASGAEGGRVLGISLVNTDGAEVSQNRLRNMFGAAGAVGSAGGVGTHTVGGNGGDGGNGGSVAGLFIGQSSSVHALGNEVVGLYGAAGGMGAVGAFGSLGFGKGGMGADGGHAIGIWLDDCSACGESDNTIASVQGGMGALGAVPFGKKGKTGISKNVLID